MKGYIHVAQNQGWVILIQEKWWCLPHDFFSISRAWRMMTQVVKKAPPASSNYFCSKYYQGGLAFALHSLTTNDVKIVSFYVQCRESNPGAAAGERGRPTPTAISPLSCPSSLPLTVPPNSLFASPCPHPTPTSPRVYSSYRSWACPLAAGQSCLQAGNCRNSPLVVFSFSVWAESWGLTNGSASDLL